jgi:membrane protease YdiL (CAAX protease family)
MSDAVRAPGAPRALNFFETLGVALAIYTAFGVGGWLTGVALMVFHVPSTVSSEELSSRAYRDAIAWLSGFMCAFAVIWLAVRRAGWQFQDYLALKWPRPGELMLALIAMFAVLQLIGIVRAWLGPTADNCVITDYQSARDGGSLFLFLATACVGAPIVEEFAVRGFLFRGWSESFLQPAGAIVLGSALWAMSHIQYDWSGKFEIFVTGLVLGTFRYRSGSTYLAVVVHSAINLYVFVLLGLALAPP